jgi:DNA-binding response OmpR family regulator
MFQEKELSWEREPMSEKLILVVEDDEAIGTLLVQILAQEACYQALLAVDGFEALNVVREVKPDLFILDYQLPAMNGIQLYDSLHAISRLENVPAILLSARLPQYEVEKRSLIGLGKPFDLDELLEMVNKALRHDITA